MDLGIAGKVALVMGARKGIGRGIAEALAAEGARVALCSRGVTELEGVAAAIGRGAAAFEGDIGDTERMAALPGEIEAELGPVEILVLNGGGPPPGGALDHGEGDWEDAYRSLVLGPRALVDATVPGMRERGWGRVVSVSSSSVRAPIPGLNLSNSHRMALVGFLKTLATEVGGDGVTVNTVATGRFATDRLASVFGSLEAAEEHGTADIPVGRLGLPSEYGDLVAFLCSERAAFLTGTVIPLDGGMLGSA